MRRWEKSKIGGWGGDEGGIENAEGGMNKAERIGHGA